MKFDPEATSLIALTAFIAGITVGLLAATILTVYANW